MEFNPVRAVGIVEARVDDSDESEFRGSCFSLRDSTAVVTAAHCVADVDTEHLRVNLAPTGVMVHGPMGGVPVREVIVHPQADVAILRIDIDEWVVEPFWNYVAPRGLGDDLRSFGYPENVMDAADRYPTPRLFKGHVQRLFRQSSFMGYSYMALELDFACPAGLSGGPIFRDPGHEMVFGVATENFESTTYLDAIERTTRDGVVIETHYQRVLSYGVAVRFDVIAEWLDEHLSAFDPSAYQERRTAEQG